MTEFLLRLLGTRVEDALSITSGSLAFHGGLHPAWIVFLIVGPAALAWWTYRNTPTLTPVRRGLLMGLRVLFFLLLAVLLLRPILAFTVEGSIRRLLVVLLDDSASMRIADPRFDPADQARVALAQGSLDPAKGLKQAAPATKPAPPISRSDLVKLVLKNERLNLLPRLEKDYDVNPFTFSQGLVELPRATAASTNTASRGPLKTTIAQYPWIEGFNPQGSLTAMGDALRDVLARKRGQPLAGVLLVTDGANNSGAPPREIAPLFRQEGVPLHIYGVGITSPRDIIVANVFAPEVSFVRDEVTATVRVRAQGMNGQSARLKLALGDTIVGEREIRFGADGEQTVTMAFTPQSEGEFDLAASIDPRDDETVKDNNQFSQRLKVIDAKIKVLLVDQSPRWEFRYLQAMLLRDRRVELKCFLAEGDPAIARGTNSPYLEAFPVRKDDLFKFDLVIYGDVDPRRMSPVNLENLNELVSKFGGSLIMLAGKKFTPAAYRKTVLEKMLPVELDTAFVDPTVDPVADKPIRLELTAAGRASTMMRLSDKDDENILLWKQLPPVYWAAKVARPKPAAEVLLVDADPARESRFGKMPVIATQQYGLGQVMYVGTDNLWRWRKNVGDFFHTAIWGQISQRLSIQRLLGGNKRTQLTTDRQNYVTGDRVTLYARLYTAGYEPVQDPVVKGVYGPRSGGRQTQIDLRAIPEQPGLFRGEFAAPLPGVCQFFVENDLNTPLEFTVTEPKFELGESAMNEPLLRDLAATTGGAFYREEDLHKLPEILSKNAERVRTPLEVELWCSPLVFLLLLAVLSAEWILRKLSHLK